MKYEVTLFETIERKIVVNAMTLDDAERIARALYITHPERFTLGNSDQGQDFLTYVQELSA